MARHLFLLLGLITTATVSGLSSQQPQRRRQQGSRGPPSRGGRGGAPPPRKEGDWTCESCNGHNFKSRTSCFRCGAPIKRNQRRDPGNRSQKRRGPAPWNGRNVDPRKIVSTVLEESGLWWLNETPRDLDQLDQDKLDQIAQAFGIQDQDDLKGAIQNKLDLFSLDDSNFVAPGHNPRVKEPALCEPQVYEAIEQDNKWTD